MWIKFYYINMPQVYQELHFTTRNLSFTLQFFLWYIYFYSLNFKSLLLDTCYGLAEDESFLSDERHCWEIQNVKCSFLSTKEKLAMQMYKSSSIPGTFPAMSLIQCSLYIN